MRTASTHTNVCKRVCAQSLGISCLCLQFVSSRGGHPSTRPPSCESATPDTVQGVSASLLSRYSGAQMAAHLYAALLQGQRHRAADRKSGPCRRVTPPLSTSSILEIIQGGGPQGNLRLNLISPQRLLITGLPGAEPINYLGEEQIIKKKLFIF